MSKKYFGYYVSEHIKYCTQINEYWLNKNVCLNIVLGKIVDLVSHTSYVEWLFSYRFYFLLDFLPEICWEEFAEEKNCFFIFFVLMTDQ